ncbi:receptor-like protein EIX1 [Vitis vinifera]|uniref:receptor-like protein EIX1 n=1 Tax=Vitis vinifera TaxID=29760 RepID=UPI00053FA70B|nr:receptor-like protein EIX1 [Vitis vinifera]|eukprot:XP_010646025.1 PREDICTED: leucine-rich repeat receptor protein kinase MSP1-like [Vitis vinifera]
MERKSIGDVVVLWLWFLSLATINIQFSLSDGTSDVICSARERRALQRIKQGLVDQGNYLSSWTREACCSWKGIGCDNITRHVVKINLSREPMEGAFLGGDISTSLLDLNHLQYLDLSWNSFEGLQIPEFLGSLTGLRYLNLSNAGLTGDVPRQLGKQSSLQNLTSLVAEDLSNNALEGESPRSLGEHCNLQRLDLSSNKLVKGLEFLDLGADEVSGHFLKCLSVLSDGNSSSSGPTSVSVRGLSSLSYLDMSGNSQKGIVSGKYFANLTRLKYLHASSNSFTLQVGSDWNPPFQLEILKMGYWQLGPLFPASANAKGSDGSRHIQSMSTVVLFPF